MVDCLELSYKGSCTPMSPNCEYKDKQRNFPDVFQAHFTRDTPQDFEAVVCLGASFIESQQNAAIIQTFYEIKELR